MVQVRLNLKGNDVNRQLLEKYFKNLCTPDEVRQILDWINSHASREDFGEDFKKVWLLADLDEDNFDWIKAWQKLQDKIEVDALISSIPLDKGKKVSVNKSPITFAIAAGIAFLIISIAALFYIKDDNFNSKQYISATSPQVQKFTEKGQKLTIHLEDGSKVMLNAQSNLEFPRQFTDSTREVRLQGEAYFDVVRDSDRPFIVRTAEITTTVLGTSFNLNAYEDQPSFQVALTSGKVVVEKSTTGDKLEIIPGEMAIYDKENATLKNATFSEMDIAWKDGIIYFENASYNEIKSTLERWYGVEFILTDNIKKEWEFSGKFKNESLRNILEALQFAHDFNYKLDKKKVYLSF